MSDPLVTVVVPSFNQGRFLGQALSSIFAQDVPLEVFVMDGGSTDESVAVIRDWAPRLAGWRSGKDGGQAAAINEGIGLGRAPFVCWLNSDDWYLEGGVAALLDAIRAEPGVPAVYGRTLNHSDRGEHPVWVEPFDPARLALRCIISQPGCLIRRSAWEAVGGLDPDLHMAMDYDLWWKLYRHGGALRFVDRFVAVNREHADCKTSSFRARHYREAMRVVRRHNGTVPLKWWLAQPYAVWYRTVRAWWGKSA